MWKENAKEIGRLSLEIEESSLGRDLARRAPQGAADSIASRIPPGQIGS